MYTISDILKGAPKLVKSVLNINGRNRRGSNQSTKCRVASLVNAWQCYRKSLPLFPNQN